ncbi:MAG TPA: PEGA domain-containing protein [Candidatus Saccharimonadales bacterium]|nr:PEGA domain-containing protein [Candidatus Saccharimonadales bacterium]
MDFIDPKKQRRHRLRLVIGYSLSAVALLLLTVVLLFIAYGYGIGKNGQIIQNGLVFVSSAPNPAQIYLNGSYSGSNTNARLELPAGQYTVQIKLNGYRTWVRSVGVEGGSVERFNYPFLFPNILSPTDAEDYSAVPGLVTQSPSKQWLLIQKPGSNTDFDEYNLANPKQLTSTSTTVSIPATILTSPAGTQSLQLIAWASDNQYALLLHTYAGGSEYILFDRQTPSDSLNLTKTLNLSPTMTLGLDNLAYNQYYIYDSNSQTISTVSLTTPITPIISHVLDYAVYGTGTIEYVTPDDASAGNVYVDVYQGTKTYHISQLPISSQYLLDASSYGGNLYLAAGEVNDTKVYVYENPIGALQNQPQMPVVPIYILKVNQPNYVSFSENSQFVMAENAQGFAVYDAQNQKGYVYNINAPVVPGQHATWMDGDRLILTTNNYVDVFDYDGANEQTLQPAVNGTIPYFDPTYKWMYVIAPSAVSSTTSPYSLTSTSLTAAP